jgi:hypothetical protein
VAGAALCGAVTAGPSQITFTDTSAWGQYNGGGPFEVEPSDFGFTPAGVGENGAQAGRFLTFCMERNEYIQNGRTYNVEINTYADNGGVSGGPQDPLDARTAFLYTAFMNGTLDDMTSSEAPNAQFTYLSAASGSALQDAIWFIEGEKFSVGSASNALIALASQEVAEGGSWFGKGIGQVRVMNLTTSHGGSAQDQLVMIPLPLPVAMGMVGFAGVSALAARRRRKLAEQGVEPDVSVELIEA